MKLLEIRRDVMSVQGYGVPLCIQFGSTAFYLGRWRNRPGGWRIEILTPLHRFRISPPARQ